MSTHFSPGGVIMAPDFSLQRVLVTEERSRNYVQGSMCALKGKRQARVRPTPCVTASRQKRTNKLLKIEAFAKCGSGIFAGNGHKRHKNTKRAER